ncbi:hypothetical protein MSEDJ_13830 [Mycolicibacterium sediminis]|uniref:Uncharacterized protein n=1 Tax=Mycolicibacterium sediminis TaxID=1286180 RepID=A0A7I7QMT8_9MYCO|nr:hypothetical protein MSEDJ_13830 [Mycolicibacterium sediminis]
MAADLNASDRRVASAPPDVEYPRSAVADLFSSFTALFAMSRAHGGNGSPGGSGIGALICAAFASN